MLGGIRAVAAAMARFPPALKPDILRRVLSYFSGWERIQVMTSSTSLRAAGKGFSGDSLYWMSRTAWGVVFVMWVQNSSSILKAGKIMPLPWRFRRIGWGLLVVVVVDAESEEFKFKESLDSIKDVPEPAVSCVYRFAVMVRPLSRLGICRVEWALVAFSAEYFNLNNTRSSFTVM